MMSSYYFTGTRAQLVEKLESFDKQADFREGEQTFKIEIIDLGSDTEVSDESEKLENEPETFTEEKVEPAFSDKKKK